MVASYFYIYNVFKLNLFYIMKISENDTSIRPKKKVVCLGFHGQKNQGRQVGFFFFFFFFFFTFFLPKMGIFTRKAAFAQFFGENRKKSLGSARFCQGRSGNPNQTLFSFGLRFDQISYLENSDPFLVKITRFQTNLKDKAFGAKTQSSSYHIMIDLQALQPLSILFGI